MRILKMYVNQNLTKRMKHLLSIFYQYNFTHKKKKNCSFRICIYFYLHLTRLI